MSRIVQEKFQVNYPQSKDDSNHEWVTDKSARTKKGVPGREGSCDSYSNVLFNTLPPGSDITDAELTDARVMPMAGCLGSGTQITEDVTVGSLRKGYDRKKLLGTDDMYTREHNDAFYDVVKDENGEGFLERNNMLDRL